MPATPTAVDAQRTTAWLRRRIIFERETLERVASEVNRRDDADEFLVLRGFTAAAD